MNFKLDMKMKLIFFNKTTLLFAFIFQFLFCDAQETTLKWWNPATEDIPVIEGKGWTGSEISMYSRLPDRAKTNVREAVWNLSRNSAGLSIRFRTNSERIVVRYIVSGNLSMPHMPATGVSGVDMYAKDSDGTFSWCRGRYNFGDTVTYNFSSIDVKEKYHNHGREYRLYLPLYNSVTWLEIGVNDGTSFDVFPLRHEKPLVVYGTSIAQGGCASRPGMAWTTILARNLDRPLINLAFSGNGRLEKELIDLISEIDAQMYIIDCLPNMSRFKLEETYDRIISSVTKLRQKHPRIPILLVEHDGYADGVLNSKRMETYTLLNKTQKRAYADLLEMGVQQLFYLTKEELGLGMNSFVDGTHPTDLGMKQYAEAYEKQIRKILYEPTGKLSTTIPVTQRREPVNYEWEQRHQEILKRNRQNPPEICFFGNSIVHYWAGEPKASISRGPEAWDQLFAGHTIRNFGFGWDRVENVLWRVNHDELDGFEAKQILLMLGTNNLHLNTDDEILTGLDLLIKTIKNRQPHTNFLVIGILPRRDNEEHIKNLNYRLAQVAGMNEVDYINIGDVLLQTNRKIDESLFTDGLHPNATGYSKLAEAIKPHLVQ